jgi:hypothetical protein
LGVTDADADADAELDGDGVLVPVRVRVRLRVLDRVAVRDGVALSLGLAEVVALKVKNTGVHCTVVYGDSDGVVKDDGDAVCDAVMDGVSVGVLVGVRVLERLRKAVAGATGVGE